MDFFTQYIYKVKGDQRKVAFSGPLQCALAFNVSCGFENYTYISKVCTVCSNLWVLLKTMK